MTYQIAVRAGRDGRIRLGQEHHCAKRWPSGSAGRFEDGDRFHPASNVAKMSAGHPLTDEDRWPWLQAIADEIDRICVAGTARRDRLLRVEARLSRHPRAGREDVRIVFLDGTETLIAARLAARKGHFMPPGLLASQFRTLEPPAADENPISVSIDATVEAIVDDIMPPIEAGPAA